MKDLFGIIIALVLCGLIVWMAYRFSRMFALRMGGRLRAKHLREVERIAMGTESYITLLQCGSRYYLAGVTRQSINLLAEIDEGSLTELPPPDTGSGSLKMNVIRDSEFYKRFSAGLVDKKNRKNPR